MQDPSSKKRDSYFGIDNTERIQKFLQKLNKTLRRILYDEKSVTGDDIGNDEDAKKDEDKKRKRGGDQQQ